MATAIALEMTAELAPVVWGILGLLMLSGMAVLVSARPRLSAHRRPLRRGGAMRDDSKRGHSRPAGVGARAALAFPARR